MPRMTDNSTSFMPMSLTGNQYSFPTNDDGSRMRFSSDKNYGLSEILRDLCPCGNTQHRTRGERMEAEWLASQRRGASVRRSPPRRLNRAADRDRFPPVNRSLAMASGHGNTIEVRLPVVQEEAGSSAAAESDIIPAPEAVRRRWGGQQHPKTSRAGAMHARNIRPRNANLETAQAMATAPERADQDMSSSSSPTVDEQQYDIPAPEPNSPGKKQPHRARFRSSISHRPGSSRRSERKPEESRGEHMRRVGPQGVFQETVQTTVTMIRRLLIGNPPQSGNEHQDPMMISMVSLSGVTTPQTVATPHGGATPKTPATPRGGATPKTPGSPWSEGDQMFGANRPLSRVPTQELSRPEGD